MNSFDEKIDIFKYKELWKPVIFKDEIHLANLINFLFHKIIISINNV